MSSICSCPSTILLLDPMTRPDRLKVCFKDDSMPIGYPDGGRMIVDECDLTIGCVEHTSGNTWAATTIYTDVTDLLRFFTCPYDAASWLHAIHDNARGLKIPRGCNSDLNLTDDGCL